ncbi:sushi, von Willebrand factor type A, EGF and pentraxin domain-containing protein 1 isoform X2 [Patella vulgata]|uniref:sushi, von Willebrand factor type A, EGF and pentraxin domain-containing protein 1 isoform X2 n=1 Tax=Patella vulgata TaxID=6465 RepID=UPI0024A956BA|nr:sushi, von Willebrand factor type A, EGF and pentraxin domain-containing protein 1 isoform X2 [Patella vulgata]
MAPKLILFNSGSVVASSAFQIRLQSVAGRDIVGPIDLNHKVTILATSSGINGEVGLRPVSCDAVGQKTNSRYSVLKAGCGDGAVFEKSAGFITKGRTSRSPYFKTFHLHDDSQLSFECNFTLCFTNCDGDSCAVDCGKPRVVLNAGRKYTSTNYQSMVKYKCNAGYIQSGQGLSSCGADAVWTTPIISCTIVNCRPPTFAIAGATVSFKTTTFGSTATYSCVKGLNEVGFGNTTCTANGKWSQPTLTCSTKVVNCGRIPFVGNSKPTYTTTTYRSRAEYRCITGYIGSGTTTAVCQSNAKWTSPTLRCTIRNCQHPRYVVPNSSLSVKSTTYGSRATYTCKTGFKQTGTGSISCESNGVWSVPRISCTTIICPSPRFVVPNSTLSVSSTRYGSRATYTCKTGFIQTGPGSTTCGTNGTWSTPFISCKIRNCQRPKFTVRNSYLTLSSTTYRSTATYRCSTGYKPTGSGLIRCLSNSQWSTPAISCSNIICPSPRFLVPNSTLSVSSTTYGSRATYTCKTGFIQTGSGSTTCGNNGTWSTPLISCKIRNCQRPKFTVRNSYLTLSSTTYGSTATYRCSTGYKPTGSGLIRCLSNSQWSTPAISCSTIICPSPRFVVPNSTLSVSSTTYGSRATYTCKTGFIQTGSGSTTCGTNGTWSTPLISCKIRNCQRPKFTVRNSYLTLSTTTYGSTAAYRCSTGYVQTGSGLIRCLSNSQWSTPAISCSNKCPSPRFIVPNSTLSVSSTAHGSRATYTCKTGFIQTGPGSTTCRTNGTWSTPLISCKIRNCQRPKFTVRNSYLTLSSTTYRSTATYRCSTGYKPTGSGLIRCLSNSQWSTPAISCSNIICPSPRFVVPNSTLSVSSTTYGSRATYTCKTGFIQTGSGSTTCGTNGTWSTPLISCKIRNCQRPKFTVLNSYLTVSRTTYGSTATYRCSTGYVQTGSGLIRCLSNSQWSTPVISCSMGKCKRLSFVVPNSTLSLDLTNRRAVYRCITGFLQNGPGTINCNVAGSWSKPQINCTIVDCGKIPVVGNSKPTYTTTIYKSTVTYRCLPRYVASGGITNAVCQANGKWSLPTITCKESVCGLPPIKLNTELSINSTGINAVALYVCSNGFEFRSGNGTITCLSTKQWTNSSLICNLKDCKKPNLNIANTNVSYLSTTYGSRATYQCNTGYNKVGSDASTCGADGRWSKPTLTCTVVDCGKIPVVGNSKPTYTTTIYKSTVKYRCLPRYVASGGITNAVCQANGKWSLPTMACKESVCGLPPIKSNAELSINSTGINAVALYVCNIGYEFRSGNGTITCLSTKQWTNSSLIICNLKDCKKPNFNITNSNVSYLSTTYGSRAIYQCNIGYKKAGSDASTCGADGLWSKPTITCTVVDCGKIPVVGNSKPTYTTTIYKSTVKYRCLPRYVASGGITNAVCQANGKWSLPTMTCKESVCGLPPIKSNAELSINSTGINAVALYVCNIGYEFRSGNGTITCLSTKQWTNSSLIICNLKDCKKPNLNIANSNVSYLSTTYGSRAIYQCNTGYNKAGSDASTCGADGRWSLPTITCTVVDCGKIPVVGNSKPTYTTTIYKSTVKYRCLPRYVASGGITNAVCQANGKWSLPTMTCKESVCGLPPIKSNAELSINSTGINAVALYICNIGYEFRSGNGTITCLSTKQWTNSSLIMCNLKDCKKPNLNIPDSHASYLSTTYGSHAVYQCDTGYKKVGSDASTCGADGLWSKPTITCTVHICYIPNFILPNTELDIGETTYGSIATYSCKYGYISTGSGRIFCGSTGNWTKPTISCTASACGLPAKIQNAAVKVKSVSINGTATYTCDTGYTINTGSKTITCLSTKRWSTTIFSCKLVDCGKIPVVGNSKPTYTSTVYKSIVSYQCHHGYVSTGNGTTVCQANAKWSLQTLTCKASICGIPPPITYTDLTVNSVTVNGTGVYACSIGFKPKSGNGSITCLDTNKWSTSSLVCTLSCEGKPQFLIPYSSLSIKGSLATYTCSAGFSRFGDGFTSRCIKSNWTQPAFRCKPLDCGKPDKMPHSTFSYLRTTYRYTATYKCNVGYIQSGIDFISCGPDGKWSSNKLICTIMDCGQPKFVLENAAAVVNKTVYLSSGNYKCNAGYTKIGNGHITCGADGKWTKPSLFCKGVNCGQPEAKIGITVLKSFNKTHYGATAVYKCPDGFHQVNGTKAEITCLQDAKWAAVTLKCIETVCGTAPVIHNSLRVVTSHKAEGVATYKCKADFETVGVFTPAKCQLNGVWTKPTGSCEVINCGKAPVINNTMLSTNSTLYKTVVTYTCIHGYDGTGNGTAVCQRNKTWSQTTFVCTVTKCGIPEAHADSVLIMDHSKNGTEARYECKKGYKQIGGSNKIFCLRAIWSTAKPICEVIDCGKAPLAPGNSTTAKQASTTTYGATVIFKCKPGYFKTSGVYGSSCQLNGTWAAPTLVCKENVNYCSLASVVRFHNSRPFITTGKLGDKVTYVCEIGHDMVGKGVSECVVSGNWTDPQTKCIPVDCGIPYVPPGANVTYNKTVLRSSAQFVCGKEYAMRGLNVIICSANGQWTRGPICIKKVSGCGPPPYYPLKRPLTPRSTAEGSRAFYRCVAGYQPSGSAISICLSGTWSKPPVICTALG